MIELAIVIKKTTLNALTEHSIAPQLGGAIDISPTEAIVLLDAEVVRRLLDSARPEDTRIDDVIRRRVL